jgi:hypothetical protein
MEDSLNKTTKRIRQLIQEEKIDASVDLVYDTIGDLLLDEDYEKAREVIINLTYPTRVHPEKCSSFMLPLEKSLRG